MLAGNVKIINVLLINIDLHGWTTCDVYPFSIFKIFYDGKYNSSII